MRTIEMIKIGSSGEQLPADATEHEAVLLPAVGLMFTAKVINAKAMKQPALEKACKKVTCAGFSDWDMAAFSVQLLHRTAFIGVATKLPRLSHKAGTYFDATPITVVEAPIPT